MKVWLENNSPKTNAILGAVLSGGDLIKLAEMLISNEEDSGGKDG